MLLYRFLLVEHSTPFIPFKIKKGKDIFFPLNIAPAEGGGGLILTFGENLT